MRDLIRTWQAKIGLILAFFEAFTYRLLTPQQWLSHYVADEMNRRKNRTIRRRILEFPRAVFQKANFLTISTDNWKNALLISLMIAIFFHLAASFIDLPFSSIFLTDEGQINSEIVTLLSTSWQVLASVIGISFVLIIFLIEYMHKNRYESQIFSLFSYYTKFHFIVILGLITLAVMGVDLILLNINYAELRTRLNIILIDIFLLVLNLFLIIFLYGRTFVFVRPNNFLKILDNELGNNIEQSVEDELRKRIGLNILNNICKDSKIEFSLWGSSRQGFDVVNTVGSLDHHALAVVDIHVGLVKRAARIAKTDQISNEIASTIVWTSSIDSVKNTEQKEIAFVSGMAAKIRPKTHLALSVRLSTPAQKLPSLISENLLISKDELIRSIHEGNVSIVGLLLDRYRFIIRSFLSAMKGCNIRYTAADAERESGLFSDWPVLKQIKIDFFSVLEEALRSTNQEIIHLVTDFPIDVIYLADEYRDHLVFKRFAFFYPYIYKSSARLTDDVILKEFVYERTWRSLQNYGLRIISRLRDSDVSLEDIDTYGGYALEIAYIFNNLLKTTIDLKDFVQFESYGRTFNGMMDWHNNPPSRIAKNLERSLSRENDIVQRAKNELELDRNKKLAKAEENFIITRNLIWLGLGGWLTHLLDANRISAEEYRKWADDVEKAFPTIGILYKTYAIDSFNQNKITRMWSSWDLQESESLQRGALVISDFIKSDSWIAKYYCQRGIELSSLRADRLSKTSPTENSKYILDSVTKIVETLKSSQTWKCTFNFQIDNLDDRSNNFIELHQLMHEMQKNADEDTIINSSLDPEIIAQFKLKIARSWEDSSVIRTLAKRYHNYEACPDCYISSDSTCFGMNLLVSKAAFIKQNKIYFANYAEDLGVQLGKGEDVRLIKSLIDRLPCLDTNINTLENIIYQKFEEFRERGLDPIILCNQNKFRNSLLKSRIFTYSWNSAIENEIGINEFIGIIDQALVFNIIELEDLGILILDLSSIGKLIQYRYDKESEYPLSISITPIDKDAAEHLYANDPEKYIDQETGGKLEKEKVIRNLMQEVHLRVLLRNKLEIMDATSGVRIKIIPDLD
ncbi:MAG: hypothetical protein WAW52_02210 [Methanothrix sp.]